MARATVNLFLSSLAAALFVGAAAACSTSEPAPRFGEFRQGPGLFAIATLADAIVIGRIASAHRDGLDIRVLQQLHGDAAAGAVIKVENSVFEDTDPRWAPYAAGQTLVLFLKRPEAKRSRWRVLGISGEGELPVDEKFVYLTGHYVEGLTVERYLTMGAKVTSQRIAKADFVDAIEGLFACFRREGEAAPVQVCDNAALSDYAARSPLHRYLASKKK